jgi:hypothetical protein
MTEHLFDWSFKKKAKWNKIVKTGDSAMRLDTNQLAVIVTVNKALNSDV